MTTPASLFLVGTPIGNLGDITLRAIETLRSVDLIACEDTRETRKLLNHLAIDKPLVSYHAHNQTTQGPRLVERLAAGEAIALVTDAGMPAISDPGEALVGLAIAAGLRVVPIPGPTAFVTGLVGSGLPTGRFVFEGFLAREPKLRRRRLRELAGETRTMIFYEAPHRLTDTLTDMAEQWGAEHPAAVGRELTKHFEEFQRGGLAALVAHYEATPPRGELVIVLGGGTAVSAPTEDWGTALRAALAGGQKPTEAAREVAKRYGVAREAVYDLAIQLKGPAKP